MQLWENSRAENVRLKKELSEVKTDLELVTSQLEAMAIQVVHEDSRDSNIFRLPGCQPEVPVRHREERKADFSEET